MRGAVRSSDGFGRSDMRILEVEQVRAATSGSHPDEVIVVAAILVVLFIVGLVYYMTTSATVIAGEAHFMALEGVNDHTMTGSLDTKPRRLEAAPKSRKAKARPEVTRMQEGPYSESALLCALTAPQRLPSGATEPGVVSWRHLPEPGVCDYFILDIEPNADGSYDESQYRFLLDQKTSASRFLFALPSGRPFSDLRAQFGQLPFQNGAAHLRETLGVRGFGLLDGDRGTSGRAVTDIAIHSTALLFAELTAGLTAAGYVEKDITNFFALRPVALRKNLALFAKLLRALDGLVSFLILLSISAPRPICIVEATSAWDSNPGCFVKDDVQPTVVCPPAEEAYSVTPAAAATGECKFVAGMSQNKWRVETFETPASIERTMVRAYQSLGPAKHGRLSWFVYNVTSYVATGACPTGRTRIDKVWEVLERYRKRAATSN
ncbi:uncharacterized protein [Dermacentor albipictus]|uniref:uncharacterized protein isoform X4 n=1 Tax=Dermacentor albipictus TaxID=60249 RepID=UPI0038FD015D